MKNKVLEKFKAKLRKKYGYSTITHTVDNVNKLYLRKYVSDDDDTVVGVDLGVGRDKNVVYVVCDGVCVKFSLEEFVLLGDVAKELIHEREG